MRSTPSLAAATLYQRHLGGRFDELAAVLRRFHSQPDGGAAAGRFEVSFAPGFLPRLIRWLGRLPSPAADVPLELIVTVRGVAERWARRFGDRPMVTLQAEGRDGLLVESAFPLSFGLNVDVVAGGLRYRTRRVWFCGVPLPRRLAPQVEADVEPRADGWHADVRMLLPILGQLMQYRGSIRPQW